MVQQRSLKSERIHSLVVNFSRMETKMIKFPSVGQSRRVLPDIIRDAQFTHVDAETKTPCYDTSAQLPLLEFRGTVKLHGSNAAIVRTVSPGTGTSTHFQSRQRILTEEKDLVGFCANMSRKTEAITFIFDYLFRSLKASDRKAKEIETEVEGIAVFGEWCGMGIQDGVAICKLPQMFVIFAVRVIYGSETPDEWMDISRLPELKDEEARIFNIMQFPTFSIIIDFNKAESLVEGKEKMERLTLSVEEECPVGKHFGVTGIGEGIVWQAISSPALPVLGSGRYTGSRFWFKTKGSKHESYGRPQRAVVHLEDKTKIDSFVESVLTPGRLEQGLQVLERELLLPFEMKSVGAFIKWVGVDVMKEEDDRIKEAGIDKKALLQPISATARKWFIDQLEAEMIKRCVKTLTLEA